LQPPLPSPTVSVHIPLLSSLHYPNTKPATPSQTRRTHFDATSCQVWTFARPHVCSSGTKTTMRGNEKKKVTRATIPYVDIFSFFLATCNATRLLTKQIDKPWLVACAYIHRHARPLQDLECRIYDSTYMLGSSKPNILFPSLLRIRLPERLQKRCASGLHSLTALGSCKGQSNSQTEPLNSRNKRAC
jgi:hypothetical protein